MKVLGKSGVVELTRAEYREAVRLLREKGYGWRMPVHGKGRRELHDRQGRCVSDFTMDQCLDGSRKPRYYLSEHCLADLPPGWPQPPCPTCQGEGRVFVKLAGAETIQTWLPCPACRGLEVQAGASPGLVSLSLPFQEIPLEASE